MSAFEVIVWCLVIQASCILVYMAGHYDVIRKITSYFASREVIRDNYDRMYCELFNELQDLREWYIIEKVRSGTVTLGTKGDEFTEVLKFTSNNIDILLKDHAIPDDAMFAIREVQLKLAEIENY